MSKMFFSWTYPIQITCERTRIIENLLRYLECSVDTKDPALGKIEKPEAFKTFEAGVRSEILRAYDSPIKNYKPLKSIDAGDSIDILVRLFLKAKQNFLYKDEMGKLETPFLGDEKFEELFAIKANTVSANTFFDAVEPSVEGALEIAFRNYRRIVTASIVLRLFFYLLKISEYSEAPEIVGFGELRNILYKKESYALLQIAMFGSLLGRKDVAKMLALNGCHNPDSDGLQFSLIHFLSPGGNSPGRWLTKTDDDFRNDIKAKFDNL